MAKHTTPPSNDSHIEVNFQNIPAKLKSFPQWVAYQSKELIKGEKPTKIPINPKTGGYAKSNNNQTWGTFENALESFNSNGKKLNGVGFVVSNSDPFTGIDLDHCRDHQTGIIKPDELAIVKALNSYTEITPSGTGLRIFVEGKLPEKGRKKGDIEAYSSTHFLTVTGNHLEGTPTTIEARQPELDSFYLKYFGNGKPHLETRPNGRTTTSLIDQEIIDKALQSKNGDKFKKLLEGDFSDYPSWSEADLALCSMLAFWTGNNPAQIASIFRQSGLMRDKWDVRHSGDGRTYGEMTIQEAIDGTTETYHSPAGEVEGKNLTGIKHPTTLVKTGGYNLIQGKELLEMEEQETHWLWEGILIAGGLSWLVSKPKVGKSVTGLNLGVYVSRGEPFLGKNTTQGFVIYLALEESQDEVRKNLIKMGGDFSNIYFHFGMAPQDALQKLIILIEERKPVLIIIDIAQKFLRAKKIEDYAEAINKLEPLNDVSRKFNCQVILTGHAPKIDRELIDSILGSSGYSGSVDTIMGIKKDRNGRRSFSTIQRYHKSGQPDIEDWVLKLCSNEITIELAGLVHEVNVRDAKEQILVVLRNIGEGKFYSEPMTESQIRDEIKRDKQFTLNCLKELYQEGRILRNGEGKRNSPYRYSV